MLHTKICNRVKILKICQVLFYRELQSVFQWIRLKRVSVILLKTKCKNDDMNSSKSWKLSKTSLASSFETSVKYSTHWTSRTSGSELVLDVSHFSCKVGAHTCFYFISNKTSSWKKAFKHIKARSHAWEYRLHSISSQWAVLDQLIA